ncbi:circumsporozoite protein-like [Mustela erminea]|uniref:circumsporozoite protein-like n=1 Tax=Mustela erminea TaxID=36723 RepID=UPI0013869FCB|nr:circumsporozoite protein-like [Mustela erminea]XP_032170888.1 circumsporozoite protein-like [Mustela erminea]
MCTDFRGRGGSRRPGRRHASRAEERAEAAAGGAEAAGGPGTGAGGERPSLRPRGERRREREREGGRAERPAPVRGGSAPPRPAAAREPAPAGVRAHRLPAPARGARKAARCVCALAARGHRRVSATPWRPPGFRREEMGKGVTVKPGREEPSVVRP